MTAPSSFTSSIISFQYTIKTDTSVPTCSSTAKGSTFSAFTPKKYWSRARCPELLLGRNSESPCASPQNHCLKICHKKILPAPLFYSYIINYITIIWLIKRKKCRQSYQLTTLVFCHCIMTGSVIHLLEELFCDLDRIGCRTLSDIVGNYPYIKTVVYKEKSLLIRPIYTSSVPAASLAQRIHIVLHIILNDDSRRVLEEFNNVFQFERFVQARC